jgi:SAM-dependent methyltransferase
MDPLQLSRRKIFFGNENIPSKEYKGIEIGPFTRPTVLPSEANMFYADYYDTQTLREQAKKLNIPEDEVPEVHYITNEKELYLQVQAEEFDFIIANHVLEHVIDPFRWLKNLEFSLKPQGRFLITLPDKRLSFDKFRPDTSLAHFMEDFQRGGEISIQEHALEAGLFYDRTYIKLENNPIERLESNFLLSSRNSYHPGMHVHVFQAETFLNRVLIPFLSIGWLNLKLERFEFNIQLGEFSFSLVKSEPFSNLPPLDFFKEAYDSLPIREVSFKK